MKLGIYLITNLIERTNMFHVLCDCLCVRRRLEVEALLVGNNRVSIAHPQAQDDVG